MQEPVARTPNDDWTRLADYAEFAFEPPSVYLVILHFRYVIISFQFLSCKMLFQLLFIY